MDLSTVEEVVPTADPDDFGPGDAWLAGGTVLFSYGSSTLRRLLDLAGAGWEPWTVGDEGLEIAATCTVAQLYALPGTEAPYELVRTGAVAPPRAPGLPRGGAVAGDGADPPLLRLLRGDLQDLERLDRGREHRDRAPRGIDDLAVRRAGRGGHGVGARGRCA